MKMNFKYVSMMACAALMAGFTSCSNDEAGSEITSKEKTFATFTLKVKDGSTRALTANPGATAAEEMINDAVLYIFDGGQVLEGQVALTSETIAKQDITVGFHHFLAAVNFAGKVPTIAPGATMAAVKEELISIAEMSDVATANAFFMTSLKETSATMAADVLNEVTIEVGRAMAKVNLSCDKSGVYNELKGANGKLTGVEYLAANNPNKMYYFPVYSVGKYASAYYSATYNAANYFPTVDKDGTGLSFIAPYNTTEVASATYLMENANEAPNKGNSSYLLIKGKYEPALVVDADNKATTANADGTFYRFYNVTTDQYYPFYLAVNNPTLSNTSFKAVFDDKAKGNKVNIIKYDKGVCYYAFYLRNGADPVVKRNDYFNVVLNNVLNAGSSLPNINGDGDKTTDPDKYVPGTGGGDGDGNDTTPDDDDEISGTTEVQGVIDMIDWTVVNQNGGIGN